MLLLAIGFLIDFSYYRPDQSGKASANFLLFVTLSALSLKVGSEIKSNHVITGVQGMLGIMGLTYVVFN